jgi:hypothetical protein
VRSIASLNPRQFAICWLPRVFQRCLTAADQHRHIGFRDLEAIEHLLRIRVPIEVDIDVWMTVATEKLLDAKRAGVMHRPNHNDIAEVLIDQLCPPKDEGLHQDVASTPHLSE